MPCFVLALLCHDLFRIGFLVPCFVLALLCHDLFHIVLFLSRSVRTYITAISQYDIRVYSEGVVGRGKPR